MATCDIFWMSRCGQVCIQNMEESHLHNVMLLVYRRVEDAKILGITLNNYEGRSYEEWLHYFNIEIRRRTLATNLREMAKINRTNKETEMMADLEDLISPDMAGISSVLDMLQEHLTGVQDAIREEESFHGAEYPDDDPMSD